MHHTVAWSNTVVSNTAEVDLTPVTDAVVPVTAANHFLPQRDTPIIYLGACSANLQRARISTPTLALVTTPFIRPINQALTFGMPQRVWDLSEQPLVIKGLEEITMLVTQNGGATQQVVAVAGLMWQSVPAPPGNIWVLRGTSTSAATINVWTQVAMAWQNALPTGQYAVCGMQASSATMIAARLILENQVPRPGVLGLQGLTNDTPFLFRASSPSDLGVWGQFHNYNMPLVEVLCTAADASFEVYMDVQRLS
jgi:hypothetical protein